MPNRIVREGIITSELVNSLDWPAEVFYRRLLSVVDDFGRFHGNPSLLRAACYPLQIDKVGNRDIAKWLTECVRAGLVKAYTVDSKEYLEVAKFGQQVRAKSSKYPQMPDVCTADAKQMPSIPIASAHLDGDVVVNASSFQDSASTQVLSSFPAKPNTTLVTRVNTRATRFSLDELPREWAEFCLDERADVDPLAVFARFKDHWVAKPGKDGTKLDWTATWRNWVRNEKSGRGNGLQDGAAEYLRQHKEEKH